MAEKSEEKLHLIFIQLEYNKNIVSVFAGFSDLFSGSCLLDGGGVGGWLGPPTNGVWL